jgi:biotin operon repressor
MKAKQSVLVQNTAAEAMQSILEGLREELDDHREAINENTNELQANHEYIHAVEEKLDKLHARIEELFLLVSGKSSETKAAIQPLTKREQEVFQAVYVVGEGVPFVSYNQLARKLGISEALISGFITNLIEKGVPVLKKYDAGQAFVQLEPKFRQKQAKEVVIGLNSLLAQWMQTQAADQQSQRPQQPQL